MAVGNMLGSSDGGSRRAVNMVAVGNMTEPLILQIVVSSVEILLAVLALLPQSTLVSVVGREGEEGNRELGSGGRGSRRVVMAVAVGRTAGPPILLRAVGSVDTSPVASEVVALVLS